MSAQATTQTHQASINRAEVINLYRKALQSGVSIATLDEKIQTMLERSKIVQTAESSADKNWKSRVWNLLPKAIRLGAAMVPVLMILIGVGLVGSAVWPIMVYFIQTLPGMQLAKLEAPIPQENIIDVTPLVSAESQASGLVAGETTSADNELDPIVVDTKLDYTNLNNWFADGTLPVISRSDDLDQGITEYRLDIPKVEIVNALVKVGSEELNKNLAQYQGTALPGRSGSPVIFGHSVLRQFYNPKETNPRRYMSIFSKIMTLTKGDKIYVTVNGAQYTYIVEDKTEVKPTDTYILAQRYDVKQLKLVTCVPEGTFLRRGVVTARLVIN